LIDIEFLRRSISLDYHHVYNFKKYQYKVYQFIFFGFSMLFFILSFFIYFKTTNYISTLYFKNSELIKTCVDALCLFLAFTSFGLGYATNPDKEVLPFLIKKVKKELNKPVKKFKVEINSLFENLTHHKKNSTIDLLRNFI
jgi:hypothetical protein